MRFQEPYRTFSGRCSWDPKVGGAEPTDTSGHRSALSGLPGSLSLPIKRVASWLPRAVKSLRCPLIPSGAAFRAALDLLFGFCCSVKSDTEKAM